jgi:hypothetical protein
MDGKLSLAIGVWVSGFFAGLIAAARWGKMDVTRNETLLATSTPEAVTVSGPTASGHAQRTSHRLAAPIVAGARADLLAMRNAAKHVTQRVSSKRR